MIRQVNFGRSSSSSSSSSTISAPTPIIIDLTPFDIQIALETSKDSLSLLDKSLLDDVVTDWLTSALNQTVTNNNHSSTKLLTLASLIIERNVVRRQLHVTSTSEKEFFGHGRHLQQALLTVTYQGSTIWLLQQKQQQQHESGEINLPEDVILASEATVLTDPNQTLLSKLRAVDDSTGFGSAVSSVQSVLLWSVTDPTRLTQADSTLVPTLTADNSLGTITPTSMTMTTTTSPSASTGPPVDQLATSFPTIAPGATSAPTVAPVDSTPAPSAATLQPSGSTSPPTASTSPPTVQPSVTVTQESTTVSPTPAPPPPPTIAPSALATTSSPTTVQPITSAPTITPTVLSTTATPSQRPITSTLLPTATTFIPSDSPSGVPTTPAPTLKPTVLVTKPPTIRPTLSTKTPTTRPTLSTKTPTRHPTVRPTLRPTTLAPTAKPSPRPTFATGEPTPETLSPTTSPTGIPTTLSPSEEPSDRPTDKPTKKPTNFPSQLPTIEPSQEPTRKPTQKPTHVGSTNRPTLPSHSPSTFPSEAPSLLTVAPFYKGLNMTLVGLRTLGASAASSWTTVTEDYIAEYFSNHSSVNVTVRGVILTYRYSTLLFTTRRRRSLLTISRGMQQGTPSIVVTYNQEFEYSDDSGVTPDQIVQMPFAGDTSRYIGLLKQADTTAFFSLTGTSPVTLPGPNVNSVTDGGNNGGSGGGLSKAAKIAIGVGAGVLLLAILVALFDYLSGQRGRRYKQRINSKDEEDDLAPFTHVQLGTSGDEISTLEEPQGPANVVGRLGATESLAGYRDQSVATVDYEYTKAYGGIGNKTVSSAGGTFGSNTHGNAEVTEAAVSAGAALESSFSDDGESFDTNYRDHMHSPSAKEILVDIYAPPGKLGVVIDTPDEGAPVIHAIKDSSVIANELQVGDKLVAVDDEDVRAMSAIKVSKLISRSSENPSRKLTVLRTVVG